MAHFIAVLRDKGYAYETEDGSYYFRIAKFPEYGKLSKKDFSGMEDGARVDVDEYEKDNARDFALWKAPKPGEAQWDTEIGPGRPGWHIECSTMSMKYLGDTFDIHARRRGPDLSRITRTKSRSRRRRPASRSRISGCTRAFCWWKARRCRRSSATSTPCATWC